jgi:hypothetical protein
MTNVSVMAKLAPKLEHVMAAEHFIPWLETHEKLAGWAQFVGGVLAIWAAFMIARSQERAQRRDWERRQWALEDAALATAGRASAALQALIRVLTDEQRTAQRSAANSPLPRYPILDAIDDVREFPLHELHDPLPGLMMRRMHHLLRNTESVLTGIEEVTLATGLLPPELQQLVTEWDARRAKIMGDLSAAVEGGRASRKTTWDWIAAVRSHAAILSRSAKAGT